MERGLLHGRGGRWKTTRQKKNKWESDQAAGKKNMTLQQSARQPQWVCWLTASLPLTFFTLNLCRHNPGQRLEGSGCQHLDGSGLYCVSEWKSYQCLFGHGGGKVIVYCGCSFPEHAHACTSRVLIIDHRDMQHKQINRSVNDLQCAREEKQTRTLTWSRLLLRKGWKWTVTRLLGDYLHHIKRGNS